MSGPRQSAALSMIRCNRPSHLCLIVALGDRSALEIDNLDHIAIGVVKINAAGLKGSGAAIFLLEDANAFVGEKSLGAVVFLRRDFEGGVDLVLVPDVRIDRFV